jgi:uncharacterized membrane protein
MGVVAAATGLMDFARIDRVRKRTAGWVHLIGNVVMLTLTLINWVFRWNNPEGFILSFGLLLSLVVAVLLGVTGWYGGELVYRHKVSVIGYANRHES